MLCVRTCDQLPTCYRPTGSTDIRFLLAYFNISITRYWGDLCTCTEHMPGGQMQSSEETSVSSKNLDFTCFKYWVETSLSVIGLSQKRPLWSKAWCCVFEILLKIGRLGGGGKSALAICPQIGKYDLCQIGKDDFGEGVKRTWRFGSKHFWWFNGKSSVRFTPPSPEIVLANLG